MTDNLIFKKNDIPTMGVELEMQLVSLQSFDLAMEAKDFLRRLSLSFCPGKIKPEITQSMIEINSSVHTTYPSLLAELQYIRDILTNEASKTHIGICGGGSHPFQKWKSQRIFHTKHFLDVSQQYGYLAKQFTVFGQHIHIACSNGDDAIYLCHAMARYIPHFIALAAASPFTQGVDTDFDCSRLAVVSAFPLSGTPPWTLTWSEFEVYYEKMLKLGVIKSMKDFYWDIRPKPEYGTIELRICDTPLTVIKAAELAAFAQLLSCYLLENREVLSREVYLTYLINRFRASRYGLDAVIIDPVKNEHILLADDIEQLCGKLNSYATQFQSENALAHISGAACARKNGAKWLRTQYSALDSLSDTVRMQVQLWESNSLMEV